MYNDCSVPSFIQEAIFSHDRIINIVDFSFVKITCLQNLISLQKNRFGSAIEEVIIQSARRNANFDNGFRRQMETCCNFTDFI